MPQARLSPVAVRRTAARIRDELGATDRGRLDRLLDLVRADGTLSLAAVLQSLFPDQPRDGAPTAFRQLRARIQEAATSAGVAFALETDGATSTPPDQRVAWFSGDDSAVEAITNLEKGEVRDIRRGPQDGMEVRDGKPVFRYFVSYAHDDEALAFDLLARLEKLLALAPHCVFERWDDRRLEPGQRWRDEIRKAVDRCPVGLLLASPAFLGSGFITKEELPRYVPRTPDEAAPGRRAIPVALKRLDFTGAMDLKGLEEVQVFHDAKRRDYAHCKGTQRDDFVHALYMQMLKAVAGLSPTDPSSPTPGGKGPDRDGLMRRMMEDRLTGCRVSNDGYSGSLDKLEKSPAVEGGERQDALTFLVDWATAGTERPYFALLGDLGLGKTTTCMALTDALLRARETAGAEKPPLPIYLDLRLLGEVVGSDLSLDSIIGRVLKGMWRGGQTDAGLSAAEVIRLVREDRALIIFDGLDEVLVHLSPAAGQRFTRELFRILPPNLVKEPGAGRLLLSCRSHYFRTLRDQQTQLTAEGRDGVGADLYRTFILLPFTEVQIRAYLARALPDQDPQRVLDLIHSVHNLTEMVERPYTLSLLTQHIGVIEQWRAEGRTVTGVDLYRHMVLSWLERDTGKHQLTPDHKQLLMEHFAAALWRSGRKSWKVGEIEQALIDLLRERPDIAAHYEGKDRELLKEDLRTATFLVREGDADFRFAHSSLQEFFLASHLHRALMENRPTAWGLPRPSRETLDFLGQMMSGDDDPAPALATLRAIRDGAGIRPDDARIAELAFDYTLVAAANGYQTPSPAGFRLDGADLRGWTIAGKPGAPPLNLSRAVFRGARLESAAFRRVTLDGADFTGATLDRAEFLDGRAASARFTGASLIGTLFRSMTLDGADFAGTTLRYTKWLRCRMANVQPPTTEAPAAVFALCEPAMGTHPPPEALRLAVLTGHDGPVTSCAWSPDGARLATAGGDGTVWLWDAASGQTLAVLTGHDGPVTSCAWSPDGARLATAGGDGTVRLWDAASGEALAVLCGHDRMVTACAWSPHGARLASAGCDWTVRLWDAASGEALAVLTGHDGPVTSCTWSPDGTRLASAGEYGRVLLWDAVSGETIAVLCGHDRMVTACAWSPDGARLASAGYDGTVRLWDAVSGETLAVLDQRAGGAVCACAWSPDGARLATTGGEGTVRLWDTASGEALAVFTGDDGMVTACAWSPDGARLATASGEGAVRLWDTASGEALAVLCGHDGMVTACAWSPHGAPLATAGENGRVRLWDTDSGTLAVLTGHKGLVRRNTWSPDGVRLASAGYDGTVWLWDAASGQTLAVQTGHAGLVRTSAWSPDGARLASAGYDGTVRLWDAASGEALAVLTGHAGPVSTCAWSPDGARLASADDDGTVRLWDASSGEALTVLTGHDGPVTSCAWSPDGARLATAGYDGTVRLWDAAMGRLLLIAHSFQDNGWVVIDHTADRAIEAAGDAWRYLAWVEDTPGGPVPYPAEILGPLPESRCR